MDMKLFLIIFGGIGGLAALFRIIFGFIPKGNESGKVSKGMGVKKFREDESGLSAPFWNSTSTYHDDP